MKKILSIFIAAIMIFSLLSVSAMAVDATSFKLVASNVEVNGTEDKTVNVVFTSNTAMSVVGVEGKFSEESEYFTLTDYISPVELIGTNAFSIGTGEVVYLDDISMTGYAVSANGNIMTAVYTVDKDTPTNAYTVKFSLESVYDGNFDSAGPEEYTATINVTNSASGSSTTHKHCVCGSTSCSGDGHNNAESGWTEWTSTTSLPSAAGKYYLANNVNISDTWAPDANIVLCLNGKTITNNSVYGVISVVNGAALTITDCGTEGKITHDSSTGVGVDVKNGTFNMYGGSITNFNYGVYVKTGTFTMTGGTIAGNSSSGVIMSNSTPPTFTMTGGTITGNSGGGVYVVNGTFHVSGSSKITGNEKDGKNNNVYLSSGKVITVGTIAEGASIGVTMKDAGGTFTSGGASYASYFTSDDSAYKVAANGANLELQVIPVSVTGVTLDVENATLYVGLVDTETLTATVAPDNATNKAVTWSSNNESVATVDQTGKVSAVAPGTAIITVTTADGGKTATCTVTVAPATYTVIVEATPAEGGTVTGGGEYEAGDEVELRATANSGYRFDGWYLGDDVVNRYNAKITVAITGDDETVTYTARFVETPRITITANPAQGGTVSPGTSNYDMGLELPLTATPNDGYIFVNWTKDGQVISTDATYRPTVDGAAEYVANFAPITYTVTVNNGTGGGDYAEGASVTIIANTPETGKQFKEWTGVDGLTFTSGSATTATATFTMPAGAVSAEATYKDIPGLEETTFNFAYDVQRDVSYPSKNQVINASKSSNNYPLGANGSHLNTHTGAWTLTKVGTYFYVNSLGNVDPDLTGIVEKFASKYAVDKNAIVVHELKKDGEHIAHGIVVAYNGADGCVLFVGDTWGHGSGGAGYLLSVNNIAEANKIVTAEQVATDFVPSLSITLDKTGTHAFGSKVAGYQQSDLTALTVTVTNSGAAATGALNVSLSGTNANSFTLGGVDNAFKAGIAQESSDTFTVTPKTGLSAGIYTATVTVGGQNVVPHSFDVTFTVSHNYGDLIPAQGAVHTQTELKGAVAAHYFCDECDTYFTESKVATTLAALTSAAPTHTGTLQQGQAATCTVDGWKDYYKCSCGNLYEEAACTTAITNLDAWKAGAGKISAGHVYGDKIPAQPEIHTQTELKGAVAAHYFCDECGTYFTEGKVETTLAALTSTAPTHSYGDWVNTDPAKHWKECSCGLKAEEANHGYDDDADETCNTCGYTRDVNTGGGGSSDPAPTPTPSVSGSYRVNLAKIGNGTLVSSTTSPRAGRTITITATPNEKLIVKSISVTSITGRKITVTDNGNGTYSFTMPSSSVTVSAVFGLPFTDIEDDHQFYEAIEWVYTKGLMIGKTETIFDRVNAVTRQQVWRVLARVINNADPGSMAAAKEWAVAQGISDGTRPGEAATREEFIVMMWTAFGKPAANTHVLVKYSDAAEISASAKTAFAWATEVGITEGYADGTVRPAATATRGAFAAILYRYLAK